MKNYYGRLRVGLRATPDEIRTQYRALARDSHPDRPQGSTEDFVALREAYDVLSDEDKRAQYDKERQEWARLSGAIICPTCATANYVRRRPTANEQVLCANCRTVLPLDLRAAVSLQKQRLIAEAARVVDDVGVELATTAIDVAKSQLGKLRRRLTRS